MNTNFETIIKKLIGIEPGDEPIGQINIPEEFNFRDTDNLSTGRKLNAAFLIILSGESHPTYKKACEYFNNLVNHPSWKETVLFYKDGIDLIHDEISNKLLEDKTFAEDLSQLSSWVSDPQNLKGQKR